MYNYTYNLPTYAFSKRKIHENSNYNPGYIVENFSPF